MKVNLQNVILFHDLALNFINKILLKALAWFWGSNIIRTKTLRWKPSYNYL